MRKRKRTERKKSEVMWILKTNTNWHRGYAWAVNKINCVSYIVCLHTWLHDSMCTLFAEARDSRFTNRFLHYFTLFPPLVGSFWAWRLLVGEEVWKLGADWLKYVGRWYSIVIFLEPSWNNLINESCSCMYCMFDQLWRTRLIIDYLWRSIS